MKEKERKLLQERARMEDALQSLSAAAEHAQIQLLLAKKACSPTVSQKFDIASSGKITDPILVKHFQVSYLPSKSFAALSLHSSSISFFKSIVMAFET